MENSFFETVDAMAEEHSNWARRTYASYMTLASRPCLDSPAGGKGAQVTTPTTTIHSRTGLAAVNEEAT